MDPVALPSMGTPLGTRILKVDHAGEHGAVCIYSAQIFVARLTAPAMVGELTRFRLHERRHRALFADELARRQARRCRSYWLCGFGGLVLGLLTGLMGARAIAATTVAIERVVLSHLQAQLAQLGPSDPIAVAVIADIVAEEQEHLGDSAGHVSDGGRGLRALMATVSNATEAVIALGMRL